MSERDPIAVVDELRGMEIQLEAIKLKIKSQRAIIDRNAYAKEGSAQLLKAVYAAKEADRLQEIADRLEGDLKSSRKALQRCLDRWYPKGSWQNRAASLAAFTGADYMEIAARIGEPPSRVRSVVADVRRRLMA